MSASILVVDDDECLRELIHLYLSNAGYKVLLAEDAMTARRFLADEHVDLLVADIEMPRMGGVDLVRAIRSDPSVARLPVVFVTAEPAHVGVAEQLGAAFLGKPVRAAELLASVAKSLRSGPA